MRYVAIGDSVTEGIGDARPDGSLRGWADRLAEGLAVHHGEVAYANIAVRGLRTAQIRSTQLTPAVELEPDLVTAVVGMNDLVHPGFDRAAFDAEVRALLEHLTAAVPTVLTATLPDISQFLPLPVVVRRSLDRRVAALNEAVRTNAEATGTIVLDAARLPEAVDPAIWSPDRLHPNPAGHALLAAAALELLDVPEAGPADIAECGLSAADEPGVAAWFRRDVGPWIWRRATGRSSSTAVSAKQPHYRIVTSGDGRGADASLSER